MTARMLVVAALLLVSRESLVAQVGTVPANSPFRDLEKRQDVTLLVGPSFGGRDKAGAAPRGGVVIGVRYDVPLGGSPLSFTSAIMRQSSTRDILQPGLPPASRIGGTVSQPLYMLDAALTLRVAGNKSWRSLVPSITGGVGMVTDFKEVTDSSRFRFGTRFSPLVGLGLKYAPQRSRWTIRADMTNRFYSVPYPASFRDSTPNVPRVVGVNTKNSWTRNTMLTLGLVRQFGRR